MLQKFTDLEVRVREFGTKIAKRQEGASAVEYGLLVALIAVAIILAVTLVGTSLNSRFSQVGSAIGPVPAS